MSLIDKHFKDALKNLPEQKLAWAKDRAIKKSIRQRAAQLDGKQPLWMTFRRFVAAPVAFALLLVSTGGYAYVSPSVVQGDLLYPVKTELENRFYPDAGSSEERVAYHLWLSQRRYAEVQEILERRSADKKLAFVAYAQGLTVDPLDDILVKTLQRATQHVEYAFLVTDEIKEVEKVKTVKEEIKKTIASQKVVLEKAAPVLKEVKFVEKQKARKRKVKQELAVKVETEARISAKVDESLKEDNTFDVFSNAENVEEVEVLAQVDEIVVEENLESSIENTQDLSAPQVLIPEVVEEEEDLEDAADFLLDRLSFQEDLLASMEEDVEEAETKGVAQVQLRVNKQLVDVTEEEVKNDKVFVAALSVHFEQKKNILKKDLEDLDKIMLADVETGDLEEDSDEPIEYNEVQEKQDSIDLEDQDDESQSDEEETQPEEIIIAAVDPKVEDDTNESDDENLELETVSIAAVDVKSSNDEKNLDNESSTTTTVQEEDPKEEVGVEVSATASVEEVKDLPPVKSIAEPSGATVLIDDPVRLPRAEGLVENETSLESKIQDDEKNNFKEVSDLEIIIQRCKEAVGLLCAEYNIDGCLKRGNDKCLNVKKKSEVEVLLKETRDFLDAQQAEKTAQLEKEAVEVKIQETRDQLIEIDTRIQRLEEGTAR